MMDGIETASLAVGVNINIQRTDGRVHSAIISGVNKDTKTVTVEWYERGEAKGKEIDLSAIYQHNPSLRLSDKQPESNSVVQKPSPQTDETILTVEPATTKPLGPTLRDQSNAVPKSSRAPAPAQTPSSTHRNTVIPNAEPVRQVSRLPAPSAAVSSRPLPAAIRGRNAATTGKQSPFLTDDRNSQTRPVGGSTSQLSDPSFPASNPIDTVNIQTNGQEAMDTDDHTHAVSFPIDQQVQDSTLQNECDWDNDCGDIISPLTNFGCNGVLNGRIDGKRGAVRTTTAVNNANLNAPQQLVSNQVSRKSSVVKEIERIQQRRDERRAAQRVVKELPDVDPSNPSYEFLMMIRDYQDTLDYRPLTVGDDIEIHQICVCVRKRPMNKKELSRKEIDVITIPNKQQILVHEPRTKVDLTKYLENQSFRFDFAFDETTDNELVYRYTAQPLVESIFERGMATCFAYGQTGSGKTHTMGGEFHCRGQQDCSNGIYALAARDVFHLNTNKYYQEDLCVEAAFFEIYSGKVFDLLNKKSKLRVLEDGKSQVQIIGLRLEPVRSVDDVLNLLKHGADIRTSGQTSANQHSSRSHAVFQLILKRRTTNKLFGKFSLIDLAGNERGADTSSSDRITRMEGAEINKSLLALKECIRALGRKGAHLPFRASKLTQVLRDSFIGDRSRTCMIAMISPGVSSCEHTLNTLRYADRVKELAPSAQGTAAGGSTAAAGDGNYGSSNVISTRGASVRGSGRGPVGDSNNNQSVTAPLGSAAYYNGRMNSDFDNLPSYSVPRAIAEENDFLTDDDDLGLLRSTNDGEVTEELLNFHEVVSQIERLEEEVCDEHNNVCNKMTKWTSEHFRLKKETVQVPYDVEAYASRLELLLDNQLFDLSSLKDKVSRWRRELHQEEEISSKLQKGRRQH